MAWNQDCQQLLYSGVCHWRQPVRPKQWFTQSYSSQHPPNMCSNMILHHSVCYINLISISVIGLTHNPCRLSRPRKESASCRGIESWSPDVSSGLTCSTYFCNYLSLWVSFIIVFLKKWKVSASLLYSQVNEHRLALAFVILNLH